MKVSLNQQIEEVIYELDQRARVYPRLASSGKGRESELNYHVLRMKAVLTTLEWLRDNEGRIRAKAADPAPFVSLGTAAGKVVDDLAARMMKGAAE
jgi:hypothetical protein